MSVERSEGGGAPECQVPCRFPVPVSVRAALLAALHGWLHTGDLATMDYRGFIQIEGRIRDMIIRGGENVYPPREIEDALRTYPAVIEAAVVGVPDEYWGRATGSLRAIDPRRDHKT